MKAIAYARFSSNNQREESIDAQLRAIRKYAKDNSMTILKVYTDEAESARTDDRPAFQQMMSDVKSGIIKPDCLLLHKIDRFARDRTDAAYHKYVLKKLGVKLIYVAQHITDDAEGRLMEGILESFSQYFSENLAKEVMKGLIENALKGLWNGGTPPMDRDWET